MDTPKPTQNSSSSSSSCSSDSDSASNSDFETTQSETPHHHPPTPAQSSALSRHARVPKKAKPTRSPTSESVHISAVGNTPMQCNFDMAKRIGCRRCFFQMANETCVSFDTDALQEGMVSAGSWSKVQDAESDAAAVEEEARLATVQEVKAAMSDAGIDDNNAFWDKIEEYDLRDVDFADGIESDNIDDNQEDVRSEYISVSPRSSPPRNSVVISDDEDLKSTIWNSERDTSTPAPDPPSPTLPPVSPSHPILPLIAGFDFSFRFVYKD
jgi:hypothetical protein